MSRICVLLAALGVIACGDREREELKFSKPPLLGLWSEATVARFAFYCSERFARIGPPFETRPEARLSSARTRRNADPPGELVGERLECEMSNLTRYNISFFAGIVSRISIIAPSEADRAEIFDRVFAGVLPEDIREPMRRSISDPEHFEMAMPKGSIEVDSWENTISWEVR